MLENKILLYSKDITVFWDDMDGYGHVNNAKYFTYMQECRFDWLNSIGIRVDPTKYGPVIASAGCKFLRPITYPAQITIDLYVAARVGKKTFFEHCIRDQNDPQLIYAYGKAVSIWFDFVTKQSILVPEEYQHLLADLAD